MTSTTTAFVPTGIKLHRKSRMLSIAFPDGESFELPCEYLRVHSKAAEEVTKDAPVSGKQDVNIERIEPQGNYAIRIFFDDGHDSGIYSWKTLYDLGINQKENQAAYLHALEAAGIAREESSAGPLNVTVLYFIDLVRIAHTASEELQLPETVRDIDSLLAWLRKRGEEWAGPFVEDRLRITVNREFAEPFTRLESGDEIALVPRNRMDGA